VRPPAGTGDALTAPEPKTAEQIAAEERERKARQRKAVIVIVMSFALIGSHLVRHFWTSTAWLAYALAFAGVALTLSYRGLSALSSLLRWAFLFSLAISVVIVVLVPLDSFSRENVLLIAVIWGATLVLWAAHRAVERLGTVRSSQ
jgi:hypothetical protein